MDFSVKIKPFLFLSLTFILFTAIGTISHEYGHIVIAESLGYDTTLHYGSMNYSNSELSKKLSKIYSDNKTAIENGNDFAQKAEYEKRFEKLESDGFLITIGGPLQTILTGTIGLVLIFLRRNKINKRGLNLIDWLAIFLSLFWLREVFNLTMSVSSELIAPAGSFFGGDEKNISLILNLWPGTVSVVLGIIGLLISSFIVFEIIPKKLRFTFILSGLLGGTCGFILWMNILGPGLLP
jgi:hypothetical protein